MMLKGNRMGLSALTAAAVIALTMVLAPSASATLVYFDLGNHPDGNASAQGPYGLRLDNANTSSTQTFRFTDGSETFLMGAIIGGVYASLDTATGAMSIFGVTEFNQAASEELYYVQASIQLDGVGGGSYGAYGTEAALIAALASGHIIGLTGDTTSLTMTPLGAYNLPDFATTNHQYVGFMDPSFMFNDGHRGVATLSGWGWNQPAPNGTPLGHTYDQDWLFTAVYRNDPPPPNTPEDPIPEPASLTLLSMGIAGLAIRRNRARKNF